MGDRAKYRLLIVDDEDNICEVLQYNLHKSGYEADIAHSAEEALAILRGKNYNLILLDIMMDGMSGIEMAHLLREDYKDNTPIIFLSALDTEPDILRGFKSGADDYISKPFSINQVVARVGAVINRYEIAKSQSVPEHIIRFGDLEIDTSANKVAGKQGELVLTKTEFNILKLLALNSGKIVSRENILKQVWTGNILVTERTVDVHIARLRKKMECSNVKILNRSGYGYSLESPDKKE